jgi:murein DD-endopeptidase MepM/ murein hydrolase activator NlpD
MKAGSLMVSTGDEVARGDGIGLCGNTGHSTGYHLHFELRHSGVTVCPCTYLEGGC